MNHTARLGGLLAGKTILRFAHAFESGGGTERYLDDLDRALLERNAMTIVRLHLTRDAMPTVPTESAMGRGKLICVPLGLRPGNAGPANADQHSWRFRLKQLLRDRVLYQPLIWHAGAARWTAAYQLRPEPGQALGAGTAAAAALRNHPVDLAMLHFFGGADAEEVINEIRLAHVPVAMLNHYSNDRFLHLAIRKHTMLAQGLAGVNGLGLPRYLHGGFANLSDGIDTDFFRRDKAQPLTEPPSSPLILLPARVVREKGPLDLVRAVASLRRSGLDSCIAFAGRVDSSLFLDELHRTIEKFGMRSNVLFLGALGLEELRNWYAASAVVALPTSHHEGLPRVILEAQSMGVPVVAYAMGGVAEGIENGKTGYLLKKGDIFGLAGRLHDLLASTSLREAMGLNGREAAERRFSLSALAERHEQFYLQVMSRTRSNSDTARAG